MENSFHGRTITAITATGQHKYKKGFGPLTGGFSHVPYGDLEAVEKALGKNTAAVLVEPIQGEGGVVVPPPGYLKNLKEICHENDVLLLFDEVQTGFGRTGEMFASQTLGVTPDITALAKGIAGGFPMGAVMASQEVGGAFQPGDHAATFGGGPLACAAALASIQVIENEKLLENCRETGKYFQDKLDGLGKEHRMVKEVRGRGLMLGMELNVNCASLVDQARMKGLIINCAADKVLRFVPPLLIEKHQVDQAVDILDEILGNFTP